MGNFTACSGDCHQGRKQCPCPKACEQADDFMPLTTGENVFLWSGIAGGLAVFAWSLFALFGTNPF